MSCAMFWRLLVLSNLLLIVRICVYTYMRICASQYTVLVRVRIFAYTHMRIYVPSNRTNHVHVRSLSFVLHAAVAMDLQINFSGENSAKEYFQTEPYLGINDFEIIRSLSRWTSGARPNADFLYFFCFVPSLGYVAAQEVIGVFWCYIPPDIAASGAVEHPAQDVDEQR